MAGEENEALLKREASWGAALLRCFSYLPSTILLICFALRVEAYTPSNFSSDELSEKAEVICNAIALETKGESFRDRDGFVATLKVLATIKGKAPTEIKVRVSKGSGMDCRVVLEKGKRYRCYLNPAPQDGIYIGARDGLLDEGYAICQMTPEESDTNPPLLKEEALKIATDYLLSHHPAAQIIPDRIATRESPWFGRPQFTITFHSGKSGDSPESTIFVNADRSVDSSSWIADGAIVLAEIDSKSPNLAPFHALIGSEVRITHGSTSREAEWQVVHGMITGVDSNEIRGRFRATPHFISPHSFELKVIPLKSVISVQKLKKRSSSAQELPTP